MTEPKVIDKGLRFAGSFQTRSRTDYIVLHHAAASKCTVEDVHRWHLNNGWLGVGYHYFVDKAGQVFRGRPETAVGAHCKDFNDRSIGICAEGDYTKEQMSLEQEQALRDLVTWLRDRHQGVAAKRHSDFNATQCPGENFPFDRIVAVAQASGTPILASARATVEQARAWARSRGATGEFAALAPVYWRLAPERGGVEPAGAYAQAAKETAFGRFGGVLDPSFCNPCGMKTRQGGSNSDPSAHQRFVSWEEGVTAHLDHLALYAGAAGYPRADTPDPRHFAYLAGAARTYEALGGKWAPSADYGISIVRHYLQSMIATVVESELVEPDWRARALAAEERLARIREIVTAT